MNGMLPALLVAAAFGIATSNACPSTRIRATFAFAAIAVLAGFTAIPVAWNDRMHFACWLTIVACSASIHLPSAPGARAAIAFAAAAGATSGAVAGLANARMTIAWLPLIAIAASHASRVVGQHVPIAPKVVSSWLIAVALLAATLQVLPVTPGYLPDHLE
jgi:hypothetical protein